MTTVGSWQPTLAQLTGRDASMVDAHSVEKPIHRGALAAYQALRNDALAAGFELRMVSGYRDFQRQLQIWNAKASGSRPLVDSEGVVVDCSDLGEYERALLILRWSALPGASRHHWGTDIDIYDAAAVPPDYAVQLVPDEVADNGPFGAMHRWLDERIASGRSHGFFRPYSADTGGVAPERWHLSYAPLAAVCQRHLTSEHLFRALHGCGKLALWEAVAQDWETIYQRFVMVPWRRYPQEVLEAG